jgi:hypothetical protein
VDWVVHVGLGELALGALLGWAMVAQDQRPELLRRWGVIAPHRIRQTHLDYIFMGLILIAVGLAIPSLPQWVAIPLVFGTIVNPFLFVPQMFSRDVDERSWYRALAIISFSALSLSLVAAAIHGPG